MDAEALNWEEISSRNCRVVVLHEQSAGYWIAVSPEHTVGIFWVYTEKRNKPGAEDSSNPVTKKKKQKKKGGGWNMLCHWRKNDNDS